MICDTYAVHVLLSCGAIENVYRGSYGDAYSEWADLVETHPVPVDMVVLTKGYFNPETLRMIPDLLQNSDIVEIG